MLIEKKNPFKVEWETLPSDQLNRYAITSGNTGLFQMCDVDDSR